VQVPSALRYATRSQPESRALYRNAERSYGLVGRSRMIGREVVEMLDMDVLYDTLLLLQEGSTNKYR